MTAIYPDRPVSKAANLKKKINEAIDEFLEPEDHECWFEPRDLGWYTGAVFVCAECGAPSPHMSRDDLAVMYNAMRHLDANMLMLLSEGEIARKGSVWAKRLRAAAEALVAKWA